MLHQWGKTSLIYATAKGDLVAIKLLIDAGADLRVTDYVLHSLLSPLLLRSLRAGGEIPSRVQSLVSQLRSSEETSG
jgi:hypothetical protein